MSIELVMPSNHLILCCPLLLLLQSFPASGSFQISLSYSSIISRKHPTSLSKQSYVWFPTLPTHSNNLNNLSLTKCRDEAPWPHQLNQILEEWGACISIFQSSQRIAGTETHYYEQTSLSGSLLLFSCQVTSNSVTPWTVACQASLSFTIPRVCSNSCPLSQ